MCFGELAQRKVPENAGLDPKLFRIVAVLEVTAAAGTVPGAGRLDPCRVGFNNCGCLGVEVLFFVLGDGDGHFLVRQGLPDKDDSSIVEPAKAKAAIDDFLDPDRYIRVLQTCFSVDFF